MSKPAFDPAASEPLYEIRRSSIHGTGVFAATDLHEGQRIMEYKGELISKEESERRGLALMDKASRDGGAAVYIFTLNDEWDLDGDHPDNDARLINHSCDPNCEAWDYDGRLFIEAKRAIPKGEELSFNYSFGFDTWEDHPCRCGAANCVGYILAEEYWPRLKKLLARRAAAASAKKAAANSASSPKKAHSSTKKRPRTKK